MVRARCDERGRVYEWQILHSYSDVNEMFFIVRSLVVSLIELVCLFVSGSYS